MNTWWVQERAEVGSTQDEIRLVIDGVIDGLPPQNSPLLHPKIVVRSDSQSAGRGRTGRVWQSKPGNFYATFALAIPQNDPDFLKNAANYSFVAALAVSESLKVFLDGNAPQIHHKWPNDVLINGQKIAGILIEIYAPYLLIGIGVNLAHAPDLSPDLSPAPVTPLPATALSHFIAPPPPSVFLRTLCAQLDRFCGVLRDDGFAAIRGLWLKNAYGLGGPVTIRTAHEVFTAEFEDLEPDGALRVFDPAQQKTRKIYSADIFFN